jgi:hypothetical protein
MADNQSKKINQTAYVKHRDMSQFVNKAIRKELEIKKAKLRKAYFLANQDPGQREAINDWKNIT